MTHNEVFRKIAAAIEAAPEKRRTAEMHLQMIKYSNLLDGVSGREFCAMVGIGSSFATEFTKMRNIRERLEEAGLNVDLI